MKPHKKHHEPLLQQQQSNSELSIQSMHPLKHFIGNSDRNLSKPNSGGHNSTVPGLNLRNDSPEPFNPTNPTIIRVNGLIKCFGLNRVLDGIDMEVGRGEVVSLMGQSGGGKTTLLRCINLLEEPSEGVIEVEGEIVSSGGTSLKRKSRVALRQKVGMVFQNFNIFQHLTAVENVALPLLRVANLDQSEALRRSFELLDMVGLAQKALSMPPTLSGGQCQRVAIARALALRPIALLFDEPTSALDPESSQEVLNVMRELSRQGMTMIVSTHEVGFALEASDRVIFMDRGKILDSGSPDEVIRCPRTQRAKEFFGGYVRHGGPDLAGGSSFGTDVR